MTLCLARESIAENPCFQRPRNVPLQNERCRHFSQIVSKLCFSSNLGKACAALSIVRLQYKWEPNPTPLLNFLDALQPRFERALAYQMCLRSQFRRGVRELTQDLTLRFADN